MMVLKQGQPQVLIIEPSSSLKTYYSNAFIKMNFEPIVVHNGQAALEFLRNSIDGELKLAVMDWNLPDINGFIVAQRVRQDPRLTGCEFLICAAELNPDDKMLMLELDVTHVLPKGASMQQIVEKAKQILNDTGRQPRSLKLRAEFEAALAQQNKKTAKELLQEPELKKILMQNKAFTYLLGEFEVLQKNYAEALSLLQPQIDSLEFFKNNDPESSLGSGNVLKAANVYGKALCYLGKYADAEKIFDKLFAKSPKNIAHIVSQAETLLGQDKVTLAKEKYATVLQKDAANPNALLGMGKAAVLEGNMAEAQGYFAKAGQRGAENSSFASFFNNKAVAMIHAGKITEAIGLYENALNFIKGDQSHIQFNLGMAYLRLGKASEAADIFEGIVDAAPQEFIVKKTVLLKFRDLGREKFIQSFST